MNAGQGAVPLRVFLERSRELAALASSLQAARSGRGTVCLVSGEAGIGKSRLITEFAADCERQGLAAHWGSAWEAGGAPVYWPWIQILRSLLSRDSGRAVLKQQAHLAPALAQLVPESLPGDAARGAGLEPGQARFRLMDAIGSFVGAVAAAEPLLLVLEDIHATDADSLLLLEFVTRQLRGSRTLVLASYRESELHRPRVGEVVTRVRREAVHLPLGRFGRDTVREYVRAATGERPLEQTVAEIFALTEGHPLHLKEVVELGIARGGFRAIPASLTLAIQARVASLPPDTQALLRLASVLGREIPVAALAELAELPAAEITAQLAPAVAIGLLDCSGSANLRFEHMLVREALHDGLHPEQRRALHARRAQRLLAQGEENESIPWPELAGHLEESGPVGHGSVVDAWRRAAAQADARQAFDDAALCSSRALAAADHSPATSPDLRPRLLLELATAQIRAGDLDAGRRNATEAFALAEALPDASLMADAALTYGGIFTFGKVDQTLVNLLGKAAGALGESSPQRKARVQARLAAAMQPAADPGEPIRLAQQAIGMARSTGDARTLLSTLRSAISALMDLGDPHERMRLNREYVALAESLGDASERMRGYMRLVVDAMELADAGTMDFAVDQCSALAHELGLPQYQWTAAALRVMQATIRGNLNVAAATLEQAGQHAQRSEDPNAAATLLMQRAALAELRGTREEILALLGEVERSFAVMPVIDATVKPYLLLVRLRCGEAAPAAALDGDYVRRIIRFRDLGVTCTLGEYLVARGELPLAAEVYESLLPHHDLCGHWGLLGLTWSGPVARVLGIIAGALGRPEEAQAHFSEAHAIAQRMNARPMVERIAGDRATAQSAEHGRTTAPAIDRGVPSVNFFRITRDGDGWVCECEGQRLRLRDSRGLQMLARLVAEAGREIHVLDLAGTAAAGGAIDAGDSGEWLDERARRDYRRRVEELRADLEEAELLGDAARAEAAREELEQLSGELARAFGLGGRPRKAGSAVERARVNVQRRLKDAQARIARESPAAGRHLEWALRTGLFCTYRPG